MNLAITIWENRISPVFDVSRNFGIYEVKTNRVCEFLYRTKIEEASGTEKINCLLEFNINYLICGAISRPVYLYATSKNIEILPFIRGEINDVLETWKSGTFKNSNFLPGCYGRNNFGNRFRKGKNKKLNKNK